MMLVHRLSQPGAKYVSIKLGCFDIGVAEHGLETTQVRPTFQQMGGEGMPQHVGAQLAKDTGRLSVIPKQLPEALARHARSPSGNEQIGRNTSL
jgi:hypothetical protein